MDVLAYVTLIAILVGLVGLLTSLVSARCAALMHDWARQAGWEISARRRCIFRTGPFGFMPGMPVYHVEVVNRAGQRRQAFIRCGDVLTSVLSAEIAVEWADFEPA